MNGNTYTIENSKFIYRTNLAGDANQNPYGDDRRMATFLIPADMAEKMEANGIRVKWTRPGKNDPHPEEFEPQPFVQAQAKYTQRNGEKIKFPPKIYIVTGNGEPAELLEEEDLERIDRLPIKNVNVVLNEYIQEGKAPSLYIRTMYCEVDDTGYNYDPFADRYTVNED